MTAHLKNMISQSGKIDRIMEYIELKGPGTVTYSRKPTAMEIKLGYGARHYLTIEKELVRKPNGDLKRWFIHTDGLRYYYL